MNLFGYELNDPSANKFDVKAVSNIYKELLRREENINDNYEQHLKQRMQSNAINATLKNNKKFKQPRAYLQ